MPIQVIFLIAPRTHFLDLAGPDQVFSEAIFYKAPFEVRYCSFAPEKAGTASGLQFANLPHYSEIRVEKGDYVFIPGMDLDVIERSLNTDIVNVYHWLSSAYNKGAQLCSVCTGAFLLGAAGLLDGKPCTTHWKYTQRLQQRFPQARRAIAAEHLFELPKPYSFRGARRTGLPHRKPAPEKPAFRVGCPGQYESAQFYPCV
ncbi:MAG: DJ-1/PfpI family protein [Chitinophagales bacterium]|nr:DJ-1/PfpI family protein [Chitinophagales bacterium]